MNKTTRTILLGIAILIIIVAVIASRSRSSTTNDPIEVPSDTISDGNISIPYSEDIFGLAVNADQILVNAYIPPCDPNFSYCFYFTDETYKGTNFNSAGLRIAKRTDLTNERLCLQTPPAGYEAGFVPQVTSTGNSYAASLFPKLGDAAMGHYVEGELYRVYLQDKLFCYEFETRIGESRFENYEEGSIKKFTDENKNEVRAALLNLLRGITLSTGGKINFPRI